jgi:carboxynorspermidine decarboxylase
LKQNNFTIIYGNNYFCVKQKKDKMNIIVSPSFVLEEKLLKRNLDLIGYVAHKAEIEIIMALKAFGMWKIFPLIGKHVNGASASSLNEAKLIFEEMGVWAHTYSPAFKTNEFDEILDYSNHIIFNSFNQFHQFKDKVKSRQKEIGIRINPEYSPVSTSLYNACTPGSRFGVSVDQFPEQLPVEIDGFHFHALCESDSYALADVLEVIEEKFGRYFKKIKWLNLGGGHLMTRKDYDIKHLIRTLSDFRKKHQIKIILEPGSAFTWQTGFLQSTIIDIVENKNIKTAILDVSFTAHMPDCLEMPYKPEIRGAKEPNYSLPTYRMGGNSCLSGDFIGDWSFEKELKIGDTIIFEDMIHYTMVKTTTFNGVQHPTIGILKENGVFEVFKTFVHEDYKNRLS